MRLFMSRDHHGSPAPDDVEGAHHSSHSRSPSSPSNGHSGGPHLRVAHAVKPSTGASYDSGGDVDDVDEVDDGNKNIILGIISQLRIGSDLSRITLPTFILERKSMLERISNLMQHPYLLMDAQKLTDPVDRFVEVVRWYMSGWHIAPKAVKKPLNPVLGEYFSCWWDLKDGSRAFYISEQTSHHPPKSSYFYAIPEHNIQAHGLLLPRSRFLGNSAASMMEGIGYLDFLSHNETYEITQPNIYARGILMGNLKYEMGDHAIIECPQLDMRVDIEFKVKGFISGNYHSISGKIEHHGKPIFELSGKWNEVMYIKDLRPQNSHHKQEVFFNCHADTPLPPLVRPLDEQGEFESRKLWLKVTRALGARDHETATDEKFKIEEAQRTIAKDRVTNNEPFQPRLFVPVDDRIQYKLWVEGALAQAQSADERSRIIRSAAPILPGDKFPDNFDEPAEVKLARGVEKINMLDPAHTSIIDEEGDVFVDAIAY